MAIKSGGPMAPVSKYLYGIHKEEYDPKDIIHNRSWSLDYSSPGSHLFGISPLKAARRSITMSNDGREAQTSMLKNMGSKGLLAMDVVASGLKATPTPEQLQSIKDKFNAEHRGIDKAGRVSVASGKFEWHQMGMSAVDMSIIESQKWSKADICQVYGMSPILLASMDAATYSNYKEAKKAAITMAVIPLLRSEADTYNDGLVPEFAGKETYILDHDLTVYTELQEDREKQAAYLEKCYWLQPDEKRIEMGYGESGDPLMQKYYFPGSLMELNELNRPADIGNLPISGDYE
jgi:HK97 family phage portal protein